MTKAYKLFIKETLLESFNDSAAGSEKDDVFFLNNITVETRDLFMQTTKEIAFKNEIRIERENGPRTRYAFVTKTVNRNNEDIDSFVETEFGEIFLRHDC